MYLVPKKWKPIIFQKSIFQLKRNLCLAFTESILPSKLQSYLGWDSFLLKQSRREFAILALLTLVGGNVSMIIEPTSGFENWTLSIGNTLPLDHWFFYALRVASLNPISVLFLEVYYNWLLEIQKYRAL